jgi:Tol biopolymer transport system component/photosystem II stability/assembly factor-like uncharacterized protein
VRPLPTLRIFSAYRSLLLTIGAVGVGVVTCWATLTGYTARRAHAKAPANPSVLGDSHIQPGRRAVIDKNYGKLPLSFEVNRGQTDANARYVARGPGYNIFLTSAEAVLVFQGEGKNPKNAAAGIDEEDELNLGPAAHLEQRRSRELDEERNATGAKPTVVRMRLEGANVNARGIEGVDELPGKVNYFLGNDSSKWLTDIPTYSKVAYRNVYSGVDLVYYGNRRQLEYDLVISPGTDPGVVKVKYQGTKQVRVDRDGNLLLTTAAGEMRQQKPLVYQEEGGARKLIEGRYVMRGKNRIGFRVSHYDRRRPLVIDPVLNYFAMVNNSGNGYAITVDAQGSAYITGATLDGNFNPTPGGFQQTFGGGFADIFVTKINPSGDSVLYSTYLGGADDDEAYGIAVDGQGSAYVTGYGGAGYPVTAGAYQTTLGDSFNAIITKLNPTGSGLVYSTYVGGSRFEEGDGIVLDGAGNAYVVGHTESANFPTTAGVAQSQPGGGYDAFVLSLNVAGSGLRYSTFLGGAAQDFGLAIAIDSATNAYVSGQTRSLNFPTLNPVKGAGGLDRGLFKSVDSGSNWSLSRSGLNDSNVAALAVAPSAPTTVYAATTGTVYKSTNSGGTWTATNLNTITVQALAVDPTNSSVVYAGALAGIYKTTDGGSNWSQVYNSASCSSLAIDPTTPTTVYAGVQVGIVKSTNAGGNWTLSFASGLVRALAIDPTNPLIVYAGRTNGIVKTTNGGTNWNAANTGLTNTNVRSFAISASSPATIYAGTLAGVFKSTNGGTNWSAVNNGLLVPYTDNVPRLPAQVNALAIDPASASNVYAASTNFVLASGAYPLSHILKSTDGGANWTAVTNGFGSLNNGFLSLALDPTNATRLYAGNSGDLDGFVTKLNPAGSAFLFSSYLGSGRGEAATGIAVDSSGNQYVTGNTGGTDFPTTAGAYQTTLRGATDLFITKFSTSSTLSYSTYLGGGAFEDGIVGIGVDAAGNAYVSGRTSSTDFPVTAGAFQSAIGNPASATGTDDTITKLNSSGAGLVYSSYLGGAGNEPLFATTVAAHKIAVDSAGDAYLVGVTDNAPNLGAFDFVNGGAGKTYVAKINETGVSYSITGRLTTAINTPIVGVFVEVNNGQELFRSVASDSQGFYSLISLPAGDYTVTPNKNSNTVSHYVFSPPSQTFTGLSSNQTANFQGTQVYNIAGQATSSVVAGLGIFDVTMTLSGTATSNTITDANGNFVFPDLLPGNYTVTPTKLGFTFNPGNLSFTNLSADQLSANFTTASAGFFTVSGNVKDTANTNVSSAVISMQVISQKGSRFQSALTDAGGNYSIPNLQAGGNYTFTAAKPLLSFTPQGPTLSNLSGNQTLNFTASQATGLIGKIAFIKDFDDIYVMNADGTGEQNIFNVGSQCSGGDGLAWSPDGAKLAFTDCGTNFRSDLYVVNANGTGVQRLTNTPLEDVFPSWSPDGTRLTFTYAECSGADFFPPEVFAINAAGTIRSRLTNNLVLDGISDWSPGGSTIAFSRGTTGDCSTTEDAEVYVVDANGGNQTKLTNSIPRGLAPSYSPDGFKIAYLRESSDPNSNVFSVAVYVMNADGTGQTKISPDLDLTESRPAWSPDGSKIAFSGRLLGLIDPVQMFVINADGTGLTQITSGTSSRDSIAWQHYSISGQVTGNTSGLPITMALAGTLTRVTQTDANGNYVFGNLTPGGNYSVSPISTAFGFNPAKTDITNLVGNQIANFTLLPQVIPAPTPPLADDFSGAQRDPTKWNLGTQTQPLGAFDPQVSVVQQNGRLVVTPRSGVAGLHYNGYVAVNSFDLRAGTATVQVAQIATGGADTIFAIGSDLDNFSRFVVREGGAASTPGKATHRPTDTGVPQLIFQVKVAGVLTSLSIPYDSMQHQFMRFRHEPVTNSIVFETSPNNIDFTVRHTVALQKGVSALTAELSAGTSSATNPGQAEFKNFQLVTNTFQFAVTGYSVNETDGTAQITVTRSGDRTMAASVDYATFDETAQQQTRYIPSVGTLSFAPGEMSKEFSVLVEDNFLVEGNQTVSLRLVDSFGAGLNSPGRAILTITDNDAPPITTNPLDDPKFFVQQSYFDFLGRAPDQSGLDYWKSQITQCGTNEQCIRTRRIDVSNAFFYELEFQQTGSYVYRLYRAAYGNTQPFPNPFPDPNYPGEDQKLISYATFVSDRARVLGGSSLAQSQLNLANAFTVRQEFLATYPLSLDGPAFVDAVLAKMKDDLRVDLTTQRSALMNLFNQGGRGAVIYRLADDNRVTNPINNQPFLDAEYNRAFVATQYFGYLRRDADLGGFVFWLGQVNSGPLRGIEKQHAMVCSFITSDEYQQRFSSVVTHHNSECPN